MGVGSFPSASAGGKSGAGRRADRFEPLRPTSSSLRRVPWRALHPPQSQRSPRGGGGSEEEAPAQLSPDDPELDPGRFVASGEEAVGTYHAAREKSITKGDWESLSDQQFPGKVFLVARLGSISKAPSPDPMPKTLCW